MAKSTSNTETVQTPEKPDYLSPEWHDFIMSEFTEDELMDGYPVVAGLRRVAEKHLGMIVESVPVDIVPVQGDGLGRATVSYRVTFLRNPYQSEIDELKYKLSHGISTKDDRFEWERRLTLKEACVQRISYGDVADVWHGNVDDQFVAFAVAVAATRAEARALRKALKLKTLAAEELTKKVVKASEEGGEDIISVNQINFIDNLCKKLNIDVVKFLNAGKKTYGSVNQVLRSTASKMIQELNKLQNDLGSIPEEIKGYSANWQEKFK